MTRTQGLRRRLSKAAHFPHDSDPFNYPIDLMSGWFRSPGDPEAIVQATEALQVKPAYKLVAYQYRAGGNGNGVVWALPREADFPPPEECETLDDEFAKPPRPRHALEDFMEAIDGDGSSWSYLCASLLIRELYEYGAMWHGVHWGVQHLICRDPWHSPPVERQGSPATPYSPRQEWRWSDEPPDDWRPSATIEEDQTTVTFFTFSALGQETLTKHTDRYTSRTYRLETELTDLGYGAGGFIF